MLAKLFALLMIGSLLLAQNIFAQSNQPPAQLSELEDVIENFLSAIMGFVAIVLFIFIVWGGFKYITSGGNPDAAAEGRKTITYAVIGVIVIAASYLILVLIKEITGANVTEFQIMGPN
jgi:TRAP-type C4-dicarboxylate transport system permease small subunit